MYILFEGIDTCGKSTQIELLSQRFDSAIITKEPGGTAFGIRAREILLDAKLSKRAELLLFLADRAEHYDKVIRPNQDRLILSDRGFISGIGYALANGDFDFESLLELNRFALEDRLPDKIILFMTDKKTLQERIGIKDLDGIELRGLEYLLRVQEKMRESVEKLDIPYILIDARDDISVIEERIYRDIKNSISKIMH
jgi:dTMP kinase